MLSMLMMAVHDFATMASQMVGSGVVLHTCGPMAAHPSLAFAAIACTVCLHVLQPPTPHLSVLWEVVLQHMLESRTLR